jgi:1-phosphofructokinase
VIVTLTLNPSLDRTVSVPSLEPGSLVRGTHETVEPGGKGVNVARALLANDCPTVAVFPVGGATGDQLVSLLRAEGVSVAPVSVVGATRTNITLSEPDGRVTKVNVAGDELTPAEIDQLVDSVLAHSNADDWVVASGSLPAQASPDLYATLVRRLRAAGRRVAVDTSGVALAHAVAAAPDLIKPNAAELEELCDQPIDSLGDVVTACRKLVHRLVGAVLASLGERGALYLDADDAVHGTAPVDVVRSDVGAGDCLLAGFLASDGSIDDRMANALRWAASAVELPGSAMPDPEQIAHRSASVTRQVDLGVVLVH